MMENISSLVQRLLREQKITVRNPVSISWGDKDKCLSLFKDIYCAIDKSIKNYVHLTEYDQIIDWMSNTGGLGLLLMGDCGRGKSNIITGVVPVLMAMYNFYIYPVHADEFEKPYRFAKNTMGMDPNTSNLEFLKKTPFPTIDELGVEILINNYGERYEGFNQVINAAERYLRPMFISTNLNKTELLNRYGERTLDRLQHLCSIVEFSGDSLR